MERSEQQKLAELVVAGYSRPDIQWHETKTDYISGCAGRFQACPMGAAYAGHCANMEVEDLYNSVQIALESWIPGWLFIANRLNISSELSHRVSNVHSCGQTAKEIVAKLQNNEF